MGTANLFKVNVSGKDIQALYLAIEFEYSGSVHNRLPLYLNRALRVGLQPNQTLISYVSGGYVIN